jgi:putative ABC transport system ATP-binding protein
MRALGAEMRGSGMVVKLRSVSKVYHIDEVDVAALSDIDLHIAARRFTMIVGPSGSGKTTLFNLIGCIDVPTSGSIEVNGCAVSSLSDKDATRFRASQIGYIFQSFNLIPVLSTFENVEYPLLLAGLPKPERTARVNEMLELVGLHDHGNRLPGVLSGGQRQRVAVARALIKRPSLVLADEPTANLDSETGNRVLDLMREMQTLYDTTFIFSTHDSELMRHADTLVTLRDGRIVSMENQS